MIKGRRTTADEQHIETNMYLQGKTMNHSSLNQRLIFIIAFAGALGACAPAPTIKPEPPPPPSAQELARQATEARASKALAQGISEYESAAYTQAEKTLLSPDIWAASDVTKVSALKYLAFIYCVTDRPALCRQSFERALQLDPDFDLAVSERSHPLWGPQFKAARAN